MILPEGRGIIAGLDVQVAQVHVKFGHAGVPLDEFLERADCFAQPTLVAQRSRVLSVESVEFALL